MPEWRHDRALEDDAESECRDQKERAAPHDGTEQRTECPSAKRDTEQHARRGELKEGASKTMGDVGRSVRSSVLSGERTTVRRVAIPAVPVPPPMPMPTSPVAMPSP